MKQMLCFAIVGLMTPWAIADKIVLKNGDVLNGKIGLITSSEITFNSPHLPEFKIDLSNVETYELDGPTVVDPKREPDITGEVSGTETELKVDERTIPAEKINTANAPASKWTGTVVANSALARGNTNRFVVGMEAHGVRRREDPQHNDRLSLDAAYNFGRSGGGAGDEPEVTDVDNWYAAAKYDYFWTEKRYGYLNARVEHDAIADLYYRASPGLGLGYQWFEGPYGNFSIEAGASYVREDFSNNGINEYMSLRVAYHYDIKLNDRISIFHNLEWLPAIVDYGDYVLTTDVGLRADFTERFFGQFKVVYRRDSTPAPNARGDDMLYTVGVGWSF
ncbi:MAG TPA: DUF481 domain-containing protein [Tepidisphaeraceae bacterium]|jgi:hypothetical protein